jgi:hypothetical protein
MALRVRRGAMMYCSNLPDRIQRLAEVCVRAAIRCQAGAANPFRRNEAVGSGLEIAGGG